MTIIENARQWWRLWSIRFNAIGMALLSWVQVDPVSALGLWNMMPEPVQEVLPRHFVFWIGMALFALSMLARLVVQPKLAQSRSGGSDVD